MTTADRRHQKVLWHHDLPDEPVELYSEISQDPEFSATEITATEFEHIWLRATRT